MSIDYKVIGERIRNIRIKKNISLLEISKKMNVSIAYISRIEHNNTKLNLTRLIELADILNVNTSEILDGTIVENKNYLDKDLSDILKDCTKEQKKLIYNISKAILNSEVYHGKNT